MGGDAGKKFLMVAGVFLVTRLVVKSIIPLIVITGGAAYLMNKNKYKTLPNGEIVKVIPKKAGLKPSGSVSSKFNIKMFDVDNIDDIFSSKFTDAIDFKLKDIRSIFG